jgi:hypothetical protein
MVYSVPHPANAPAAVRFWRSGGDRARSQFACRLASGHAPAMLSSEHLAATAGAKTSSMPPHIEDTVQAIAAVHAERNQRQAPLQRFVNHIVSTIGRPGFGVAVAIIVVGWIAANMINLWTGRQPWDPPPFP